MQGDVSWQSLILFTCAVLYWVVADICRNRSRERWHQKGFLDGWIACQAISNVHGKDKAATLDPEEVWQNADISHRPRHK